MGEEECEYDDQGRFFFDHDPSYFHEILAFMRTGDCTLPYERGAFESFRKQAEYWRLEVLETRCELHFAKHIKPYLTGDRAGAGRARKGPNGKAVRARALARQKEMRGPAAERLVDGVAAALAAGAELGHAAVTVTAYRPPEAAGLPPGVGVRAPDNWAASNVCYVWDPALAGFFAPAEGYAALSAAAEFLVAAFAERSFKAVPKLDASGISYDVSGTDE